MDAHTIFCSACDRNVVIVARPSDWPLALSRAEVACLERDVRCTGSGCPFCAARLSELERAGSAALPAPPSPG
jgi:hypothetical protein